MVGHVYKSNPCLTTLQKLLSYKSAMLLCPMPGCFKFSFLGGELFMHLEREGIFMEDTATYGLGAFSSTVLW